MGTWVPACPSGGRLSAEDMSNARCSVQMGQVEEEQNSSDSTAGHVSEACDPRMILDN